MKQRGVCVCVPVLERSPRKFTRVFERAVREISPLSSISQIALEKNSVQSIYGVALALATGLALGSIGRVGSMKLRQISSVTAALRWGGGGGTNGRAEGEQRKWERERKRE
jgi:hypothetical protein